jgi:endonuclease/exonuclease/phosphatase family metal-dependent hydrolase
MSWNVTLPRMVTCAEFRHRRSGCRFHFFNTHFAHRREDSEARLESAQIIAERIRKLPPSADVVLTGDFNTDAGSEPYNILTAVASDAHAQATEIKGPGGTFHGFTGTPRKQRTDWILYRGKLRPLSVEVLTTNIEGRYPSNHFPVLAVFR